MFTTCRKKYKNNHGLLKRLVQSDLSYAKVSAGFSPWANQYRRPITWALKEVDPVGLHRQSGIPTSNLRLLHINKNPS